MVEKIAKSFNPQDNEKFCVFVTKKQAIITGFDSKTGLEFLILYCNI